MASSVCEPGSPQSPSKTGHALYNLYLGASGFLGMFVHKFATEIVSHPVAVVKKYQPKPKPAFRSYTLAEIAEHRSEDDAWLIVEGKVYDVSTWGAQHPGGDVIYSYAGQDATEIFNAMHKNQAVSRAMLRNFCIGEVAQPDTAALLKDFREMHQDITKAGLMDASPVYYTRKLLELIFMAGFALYLLWSGRAANSALWLLVSSVTMACCIFQGGWTCHDFLHNQVFKNRRYNEIVGGLVIGLAMGGSAHWWKNKHNQHHATPNRMTEDLQHAVDPDIDTVPLIAWSTDLLKQVPKADRGAIRFQHILVWPLLTIAYINWMIQSVMHMTSFPTMTRKQRVVEGLLIAVHHAVLNISIFSCLGLPQAILYWAICHCLSGFGTSFVFIQSHNAMEIYNDDKDFVSAQLVSTRNINPGVIIDWLFGGLNYQIEHHLFPTMPRHSFSKIRTRLMEFCQQHHLPYETCSVFESNYKVYKQLALIAKSA